MPVKVTLNSRALTAAANGLVREVARLKTQDLYDESLRNFRNRTGNLRMSIRQENTAAAIGSVRIHYWRYVRAFTRGAGIVWIRRAGRRHLRQRIQQAAKNLNLV